MTNKEMQQILLEKMEVISSGIYNMSTCKADVSYAIALEKLASAYLHLREAEE